MTPPFIKKALEFAPQQKKIFRGASSPVIVQRVTKRAIKLKTRLPNSQLTQILKCHQQLPKRLQKCWRTKLLSEKPIAIRFSLHFCRILSLKLCGNYPRKATVFLNNKKETSKAINSGSLGGSYILHPILQYCLLHDPGHRKSRKRKLPGFHCNETKKVGVLKSTVITTITI